MNARRRWIGTGMLASLALAISGAMLVAQDHGADTNTLKGKPAPEVAVKTLDGKSMKLSEQKGSVVVMDFWATWCPPCRASLPHVQKLADNKDLAAKGLKVWAVNAHEKLPTIKKFVTDNKYTFNVPLGTEGTMKQYLVQGIPTTVIVGRDGTIKDVFIGYGGEESDKALEAAIDAALAEAGPTS